MPLPLGLLLAYVHYWMQASYHLLQSLEVVVVVVVVEVVVSVPGVALDVAVELLLVLVLG